MLLAILGLAGGALASEPPAAPRVGAYLWGGLLRQGEGIARFHASVDFLLRQGFPALRFTVTENSLGEAGVTRESCPAAGLSGCALRQILETPAFDRPGLSLLMVTLHENAARQVLNEDLDEAGRTAIAAELRGALEQLRRRFAGRRLTVVISNWEGDNMVYCGGVWQYMRSAGAASACDTADGQGVARRLARFTAWMELRQDIIEGFRREHPEFDLRHAPEFNIALLDERRCMAGCDSRRTVYQALAQRRSWPLCSYSSYNSTQRGTLEQDIGHFLEGCQNLILGELGFAEARQGDEGVREGFLRAGGAIAAHGSRIPAVMIWNAFNQPGRTRDDSFGLYREDGTPGSIRNLPPALLPSRAPG